MKQFGSKYELFLLLDEAEAEANELDKRRKEYLENSSNFSFDDIQTLIKNEEYFTKRLKTSTTKLVEFMQNKN